MSTKITPDLVLLGYRAGVFPMADEVGTIHWYSPDPRCILEFSRFRVTRSLRQAIRRKKFEIRMDTAFDEVIGGCANRPEGTWISAEIVDLYRQLHRSGHAHSVESWANGQLAGGLYGVASGAAFFGESMFHRVTDASKVVLVALMEHLRGRGYLLVDAQWTTPHLERFGAVEIPRSEYLRRLQRALAVPVAFNA